VILPETFFDFLPWIWVGLAVWLALWWRWLTKTTRAQKGLFSAGIIIGLAMWRFGPIHPRVVIVHFSKLGAAVDKQRGRLLFPKHYTFQNGATTWLWTRDSEQKYFGTIVVNDSPETLRIQYVTYANNPMLGLGDTPPTPVPPLSTFDWKTSIDDVGPDETPPDATEGVGGMAVRAWLTWGDASDT
jgi:hypothetical protein